MVDASRCQGTANERSVGLTKKSCHCSVVALLTCMSQESRWTLNLVPLKVISQTSSLQANTLHRHELEVQLNVEAARFILRTLRSRDPGGELSPLRANKRPYIEQESKIFGLRT